MNSIKEVFEKFEKKHVENITEFLDEWNQLKSEIQEIFEKEITNSMKRFVDYDVEISQLKKEVEKGKIIKRVKFFPTNSHIIEFNRTINSKKDLDQFNEEMAILWKKRLKELKNLLEDEKE